VEVLVDGPELAEVRDRGGEVEVTAHRPGLRDTQLQHTALGGEDAAVGRVPCKDRAERGDDVAPLDGKDVGRRVVRDVVDLNDLAAGADGPAPDLAESLADAQRAADPPLVPLLPHPVEEKRLRVQEVIAV